MDHLVFCGFDVYLKQLQKKAAELIAKYPEAGQEAFKLYDLLEEEQKQFIAPNSTISAQAFAKKCQTIIKEAPKAQLETHRGIGMIFNGMLNALIFLANMVIGAGNLIFGRFELIDSNRIKTESIQQVNAIDVSLEALKTIRARETQKAIAKKEECTPATPKPEFR